MSKLWRYNLHYFDYLQDPLRSLDSKCRLISNWIALNPPGTPDAWEPYPVSLRIVNWIKFFLGTSRGALTEQWLYSLYGQAYWLERHFEYDLLANHLLKNAVALFFAGMFFDGPEADRWLDKGQDILTRELHEQFLEDGGHFERSPMYHSICLVDYLDVINLVTHSKLQVASGIADQLNERVISALQFLDEICLPDGDIPLFNDSAHGIAPPPAEIFAYAAGLVGFRPSIPPDGLFWNSKPQSGYYALGFRTDKMIIDCGAVGPEYQPGHAHCDTLSFELVLNGHRVIVDSGVSDYESGPRRDYIRSTQAHNTLRIDGTDQSEVWGTFRLARRARPLSAKMARQGQNAIVFQGAHDGYTRLSGNPVHRRMVEFTDFREWLITDRIEGRGNHKVESFVHFHPDCAVRLIGHELTVNNAQGVSVLTMSISEPVVARLDTGQYAPEFGKPLQNTVLVMTYSGPLPVTLAYRLTTTGHAEAHAS